MAHPHHQQQDVHMQLNQFWQDQLALIEEIDPETTDFKTHELPLARIKKIMKQEDEINPDGAKFMISSEGPTLFAKACELFILELTIRAWGVTEENKRRTLQRTDIGQAVQRSDLYDFLIDIVPREEVKPLPKKPDEAGGMQMVDPSHYVYLQQQAPAAQAQALQYQHMYWQSQLAAQQQAILAQQQQQQQQQQQPAAQGQQQPPASPHQSPESSHPPPGPPEDDDDDSTLPPPVTHHAPPPPHYTTQQQQPPMSAGGGGGAASGHRYQSYQPQPPQQRHPSQMQSAYAPSPSSFHSRPSNHRSSPGHAMPRPPSAEEEEEEEEEGEGEGGGSDGYEQESVGEEGEVDMRGEMPRR